MAKQFNIFNDEAPWDVAKLTSIGKVRNVFGGIKFFAALSTTSEGDVWYPGGTLQYLTTAEFIDVVSSNAVDTAAGAGARTVKLIGLGEDWLIQYETVALNGLTPVRTTKKFVRVFRASVETGGTSAGAVGNITLTAAVSATTQAYIKLGANQTLMSHFTPPANMSMLIMGGTLAASQGKSVHYHVKTRAAGKADSVWKIKRAFDIYQATAVVPTPVPRLVPSLTDYKWTQTGTAAGDKVSGDYSFLLLDNALINMEEAMPLEYEII